MCLIMSYKYWSGHRVQCAFLRDGLYNIVLGSHSLFFIAKGQQSMFLPSVTEHSLQCHLKQQFLDVCTHIPWPEISGKPRQDIANRSEVAEDPEFDFSTSGNGPRHPGGPLETRSSEGSVDVNEADNKFWMLGVWRIFASARNEEGSQSKVLWTRPNDTASQTFTGQKLIANKRICIGCKWGVCDGCVFLYDWRGEGCSHTVGADVTRCSCGLRKFMTLNLIWHHSYVWQ